MTDERADGVFLTVHLCRDHVGMAAIRSGARAMKVSPRQIETNADCDLYLLDTRGRLWRRSLGEHWQELELPDDPGPIPQDSSSNADSTPDDTSDPILDIQSVRLQRDELKRQVGGLTASLKCMSEAEAALKRLLRGSADDVDRLQAELTAEKKYVEQLNRENDQAEMLRRAAVAVLDWCGVDFVERQRVLQNLQAAATKLRMVQQCSATQAPVTTPPVTSEAE
jgi:hypothetical protein